MTKTQEEAYILIENLVASSNNQCEEYVRSRKVSSVDTKKFEQMSAKIDMLMQRDQRMVSSVEDNGEGAFQHVFSDNEIEEQKSEVNYVNGKNRGYNQNYQQQGYQNQQGGRSSEQNWYQNQSSNYNQGGYQQKQKQNSYQPKNTAPLQAAANSIPAAQESKLELMMQQLMINQQKTASEINIKVDNINLKVDNMSGKDLPPNEMKTVETQEPVVVNAEPETVEVAEPVEVNVEKETVEVAIDTPPLVRVYTPKLPYPVKQKKSRRDLEAAKCKEMVSELTVKLSFEDVVEMMAALKRYVKSLVTNKASPKESVMSISKRCSTLLQSIVPENMEDPGSFVLLCEIEGAIFTRDLCDLGSNVNLMPYTVAKRLGFTNFRPTKIQLVFADRSVRHPVGVVLDIDVVIGNYKIPADFVVLEMNQEPKDPLIWGHPLLATAGAIINVKRGKIDLHLGDINMKFEVDNMLKRPNIGWSYFSH
ncbi:hypothetical protein N665_0070s0029 [Sinapis alba]|nr:hypothetical protein N665_0070s0029 [Sinapis alba]